MATYVLLLNLTPEGRERMLRDPDSLRLAEAGISIPGILVLGLYGVLGPYDFVTILEAPSNEAVASFSIELGVRAGLQVISLPAIPIARLEKSSSADTLVAETDAPQSKDVAT